MLSRPSKVRATRAIQPVSRTLSSTVAGNTAPITSITPVYFRGTPLPGVTRTEATEADEWTGTQRLNHSNPPTHRQLFSFNNSTSDVNGRPHPDQAKAKGGPPNFADSNFISRTTANINDSRYHVIRGHGYIEAPNTKFRIFIGSRNSNANIQPP
ncbi:hypothetical protein RF55_16737 [Lasius niger]|uniref:Uncharacterized protein n=1 Tax=Lasius niger TaxID=67767 RepID=A0A0J7MX33_LASNI|nr:hypothetical protein RF55_16737 [Lasius niger]